jgi:hypothetical protein
MKPVFAALVVAAALAAASSPAAACGFFSCVDAALADDSYPPGQLRLDPRVEELVRARQGLGLSTAGFYNDPALALATRDYAPAGYGAPPPPVAPVDYAQPAPLGGPAVIVSPYGRPERNARFAHAHGRRGHSHEAEIYVR